jgi:diguanylate cyclase (GGDEF)-like protein
MSQMKPEEYLHFFSEILSILHSSHEPERIVSLIVDRIVRMFGCQTVAVVRINTETEYLQISTNYNVSHRFEKEFRRSLGTGAVAKMLSTGKPILILDAEHEPELATEIQLEYPFRSAVCLQISAELRPLGYLHADAREPGIFTSQDLRILQSLADLISIALNKAYLYEKNLRLDRIDHETELEKYAPFLERLHTSIARAEESHESLSLFILDVDNYKQLGGTYGYDASKKMLREMAGLVKAHLRPIDVASRYGFDEIIVLRESASLESTMVFADGLRKNIEETEFAQKGIHTTVSIGVAAYPQNARSEKELLLAVKKALYDAQRSGRNRIAHP